MLSDPVLSGWVQERLDARIRHLLIDEFQDTNPLQWQALHAWLSRLCGRGRRRGPSVFIVGDPKQSIYRFRRAEPQVFRAAQDFVARGAGRRPAQLRPHAPQRARACMAAVNAGHGRRRRPTASTRASARTPPSRASRGVRCACRRSARVAARPRRRWPTRTEPLAWRDSLTAPRELPEEKLRHAGMPAGRRLDRARSCAPAPRRSDIMVLARKRDRLAVMEDELRALHIPAQQPEKTDLCEAPEVQDIVALLDALVSPTHDLSLARALKSPLFGAGRRGAGAAGAGGARRRARPAAPRPGSSCCRQQAARRPCLQGAGGHAAALEGLGRPPAAARRAGGDLPRRRRAGALRRRRAGAAARRRCWPTCGRCWARRCRSTAARYATPYAFVRALKAGGIPAPAHAGGAGRAPAHGARRQGAGGAHGAAARHRRRRRRKRRDHGRARRLARRGARAVALRLPRQRDAAAGLQRRGARRWRRRRASARNSMRCTWR